jgi:hypothetical protein
LTFRLAAIAAFIVAPSVVLSQSSPPVAQPDSAKAEAKAPSAPPIDFSGIVFGNFQYRGDNGPAKSSNKFDLERAYLTFRMPAGDHASIRITTDVFQQTASGNDAFYRGWVVRAKYAYLQYNYLRRADWKANARIGLLHTVFIDHDEIFWPRWISTSPTERAGYFSSADAGIANTLSFPRKLGEAYVTVTNGPGYTSRETDRFKDYAARLTLTPWASNATSPLKTIDVSAWTYIGATASAFVNGGTGQVGRVGESLARNRWGAHVGTLNPRFTAAAEYAQRHEEGETGLNTVASPRNVIDSTGSLVSLYGIVRPFKSAGKNPHPLALLARYDHVTVNRDNDHRYNVFIGGVTYDLSSKASVSLDYQSNEPVTTGAIARSHTWFAHFVARF